MGLWQVTQLARNRLDSEADYRKMQEHIASASVEELSDRGIDIAESSMLELAAGNGGYSVVFSELAQDFVATDIQSWGFTSDLAHIPFVVADAARPFPFPAGRFDLVYVASLVEHLPTERPSTPSVGASWHRRATWFSRSPPFWSLTLVGGHRFQTAPPDQRTSRCSKSFTAIRGRIPIVRRRSSVSPDGCDVS